MLVKCQKCGLKDTDRELMVKEKKGYYHPKCHLEVEEALRFMEKEYQEKCELSDEIVRIHGFVSRQAIPSAFYSRYLEPFRNDNKVREKLNKRYKEGFDYKTIRETYLFKEADIIKYMKINREKGSFKDVMGELVYVFKGIVLNNIENMLRAKKRKASMAQRKEKILESAKSMKEVNLKLKQRKEANKNKPKKVDKDSFDVLSLLDEDED